MYGLVGKSLGHSFSKDYFTEKFSKMNLDFRYENIELNDVCEIVSFVKENKDLKGFNVTIPYKESIIPFLDSLDETAKEIGAVNTVKVFEDGKLKGYNTDVIGFEKLLETTHKTYNNNALILGSGGASKAVQYVLKKKNIRFKAASRKTFQSGISGEISNIIGYDEINSDGFAPYSMIINTTPVGTFPNCDECLDLPYSTIGTYHVFIDLIYNPEETMFLKKARFNGAATYNGMTMLREQAEAAWGIFRTLEL